MLADRHCLKPTRGRNTRLHKTAVTVTVQANEFNLRQQPQVEGKKRKGLGKGWQT